LSVPSRKAGDTPIELLTARRDDDGPVDVSIPDECERARLIGDLCRLIREPRIPETTRTAGLTLIGWLARRMPGETPHAIGVAEACGSERRVRAERKKI